ncbi:hypothetical protein C8J57DRAFT_1304953 [Mycena rebaudengoi]|nr:hypothetical protein C8J57DRAFT_1304953 [Mycena rebaudengoi]
MPFYLEWHAPNASVQLRNIALELMSGSAEDLGSDVADIISVNSSLSVGETGLIEYTIHAATPPGAYHIRLNATLYDRATGRSGPFGGVPLSRYSARLAVPGRPCAASADPAFGPLRVLQPVGGQLILADLQFVDVDYDFATSTPMTLELLDSASGASAGVQNVSLFDVHTLETLKFEQFKLSAGAWKLRANYTAVDIASGAALSISGSALSDEFYIASSAPCGGLRVGNATGPAPSSGAGWTYPSAAVTPLLAAALIFLFT